MVLPILSHLLTVAVSLIQFTMTNRNREEGQEIHRLLAYGEHLDDYVIGSLISIGGFGEVYTGFHRENNKRVAIKVESLTATIPLLRNEATCLHFLNSRYNPYGEEPREPILRYMAYGKTEKLKYLVMDHCGLNLRELKKATAKDQFRYFINTDGSYKQRKPTSPFHGTVRYASLNTHNRKDQCRWDDLWSVFYIAIENMVGALPWRYVSDKNKVAEMKTTCEFNTLQYGEEPSMPRSLRVLAYHLYDAYREQESSFYSTPPYNRIIREVINEMNQRHFYQSSALDWETEEDQFPIRKSYENCDQDEKALPTEQPLFDCNGKRSFYCF